MKSDWFKNATIYALNIESFMDGNNDGVGDFQGLSERMNYFSILGVNCLWLRPFFPSPRRDNGYDVTDYFNIDPRYGTLGDFVEFSREASERGIHVLIDLVVNHTSHEHPWFQESRKNRDSKYRNYYIWSDEPERKDEKIMFSGVEDCVWEYDDVAESYYLHSFFKEQPDLNLANPDVREEILKIMGFWIELGVSGFRIDAAHIIIDSFGIENSEEIDLHEVFSEMQEFQKHRRGDGILLGEANVEPEKLPKFFGNGERMDMLFNFLINKHLFLSMAREEAEPLREGISQASGASEGQWVNFVRNHDELNLELLSDTEREEVFEAFAPDEDMRLFGHGIRRRPPPMLDNDRRRIELMYSLIFSLPGTPLINYGEEIGMGDDLSLEGRGSVRTAMQWSAGENAGFSKASNDELARKVIAEGEYSFKKINVEDQQYDPLSLLNWFERLIRARKSCPEFGNGTFEILKTNHPKQIFAHCSASGDEMAVGVHNLSAEPLAIKFKNLDLSHLRSVFGNDKQGNVGNEKELELDPFGYRWFKVHDYEEKGV